MNIGQFFSYAGQTNESIRQAQDAERTARQNQLAIEEQNRAADLKKQLAGLQMPSFQPVNVAQYTQQFMPGQAMPMGAAPAPAAPAAPPALRPGQQPLPAGVQPSQAGAGRGMVNPPMVGQPQPPDGAGAGRGFVNPPLIGQPQPQMSPQQLQRERDRIALLRGPTAALDVAQAPAAAGLNLVTMAGEQIINIGGRLVNAVTGADVAPTDVRGPRFSMTPFTDRFVREPEQALPQPPAAPAAPAAAAPAQPTKRAQSYDNKVTPYDAIIQQSAVQYGIDPVVFKRLIGTESSFNPTAVSPRGEKFGLGIAQIAAVHGLSREQMLDPNTAIPFAAQLFSQMVQQSGGNVEEALMRYKGATSAGGRAAMSKPIGDILSGLTPSATPTAVAAAPGAAPGAAPAPAAAPTTLEVPRTQARNMEMAEFYLADDKSIPYELQQINQMAQQQAAFLTQQRNETAQLAQVYLRSGTQQGIEAAMRLRENIGKLDESLLQIQQQVQQKQMYLQGMQGLRELATANDPRRLSGVLTQYMGVPVGIQPRPDGNYNLFVNGQKTQDGVDAEWLSGFGLRQFSPEARESVSKSAALRNELALKLQYDPGIKTAQINAIAKLYEARTKGEYDLQIEVLKKEGIEVKPTGDGSGRLAVIKDRRTLMVLDTADVRKEQTPFGEITLPPVARRVGLDVGR
jgi:hypothetical protein